MPSFVAWLLALVVLLVPPLSVVGLAVWARRLRKLGAPRVVIWVAYVLSAIVGLVIVTGYVGAVVAAGHPVAGGQVEPSQKARALAEGISEAMNSGALALLIAVVAAGWLWFWRLRRPNLAESDAVKPASPTPRGIDPVPVQTRDSLSAVPPINVFLSSTCYDLGDLRAELGEYLHRHAFLVQMSEDYESEFRVNGRVDSIMSCLLSVEGADVVVCILDRRYGTPLPAPHAFQGVSATHAEILHARAKGLPIFTFVRDKAFAEHDQILAADAFEPKWIERSRKKELAGLIKEQRDLALAVAAKRSNWFDPFKMSIDLRPLVLKRLLDEFPQHVGAFAMKAERVVRMYFAPNGAGNPEGLVLGTFVNAGNGPALNVECGWKTAGADAAWVTQGAVPTLGEVASRDHGAPSFRCPREKTDLSLYSVYSNAAGDRFRVEAPLRWSNTGYKREGPEKFFIWVGAGNGQWLPVT